jgi:hippurate hydrolase
VFGAHSWPDFPRGKILVRAGTVMSSSDGFTVQIQGITGHSSQPHRTINPITIAADIIRGIERIPARLAAPLSPIILTPSFISSTACAVNVVPAAVSIKGMFRCLDGHMRERVRHELAQTSSFLARGNGGEACSTFVEGYPALVNSLEATRVVERVASDLGGLFDESLSRSLLPVLASEDFAYYGAACPTAFWFVGAEGCAPIHTPQFDFADDLLPTMISMHVGCVIEMAKRHSNS